MKTNNSSLDIIAIISSVLCAIHCAGIPILLSFSTLTSLHFLGNPNIELAFIILGVFFALISLLPSYLKVHRNLKPIITAIIGFIFIIISRFYHSETWEISFTVSGAFIVSLSHYFNWKLLKTSKSLEE